MTKVIMLFSIETISVIVIGVIMTSFVITIVVAPNSH